MTMKVLLTLLLVTALVGVQSVDGYTQVISGYSDYERHMNHEMMQTHIEIKNTVEQPVLVTMYIEGIDSTPIGVMMYKTTLVNGTVPISFGFTIPENETPTKTYVNIFTDYIHNGGVPIAAEFVMEGLN